MEGSVGSDANLPILKNIFLGVEDGQIILAATNLESAVKRAVPGKIVEGGAVTVPFLVFSSVVKNLSSERVTLEERDKSFLITTDNYEASVLTQDPKDFPIIPAVQDKKNSVKADIGLLREALSNAVVAAQFSDVRPEISGVLLALEDRRITLVATDSFRLVEAAIAAEVQSGLGGVRVIIPLKTATEVLRILAAEKEGEAQIFIDQNQILFEAGSNRLISRLIDGSFPDYRAIVPRETKHEVSLNREEAMNAVKLARFFAGRANDIALSVGDNKKYLEIYSSDASLGENRYRIPVRLKGDRFKLNFNWRYLMDGFKIYKGDEVTLGVNGADRPVAVRNSAEPSLLYIVMPIKS